MDPIELSIPVCIAYNTVEHDIEDAFISLYALYICIVWRIHKLHVGKGILSFPHYTPELAPTQEFNHAMQ